MQKFESKCFSDNLISIPSYDSHVNDKSHFSLIGLTIEKDLRKSSPSSLNEPYSNPSATAWGKLVVTISAQ